MTTASFPMKRHSLAFYFLTAAFALLTLNSCKKDKYDDHPSSHTAEVLDKWMTLQLRLMRNATGVPNQAFARHYAYSGVAAVEALRPGYLQFSRWQNRWNGLSGLPHADQKQKYFYPANINAAMASMNRAFFPNASAADKAAIDSLENVLYANFPIQESVKTASAAFGKAVATAVFTWAETDGYKNANQSYTPPTGPGLWKPTAPGMTAATPFWGNNRTIIHNSTQNTQPLAPTAYSTEPTDAFYKMAKQVYDVSQSLTDDQKAMALFWRDVPGATSPGHWLSILQQVIRKKNTSLDHAALAYALTGIAINDALVSCFETKYKYNLVRPITYIREVMGHSSWNPFLGTPAHPEYSSAHSALSAAAASILEKLFGNSGELTDYTYDYLGFAPRTYASFKAIGEEAGQSRLYAGIHYQLSIDVGLTQGRKVADNILPGNYQ
ncbi:MAG TPA: hypothetical protein VEY10_21350 [Flavisolibacter sp.]|jgi:hypothetical protein|nr:hypothetical protein [Flavisolibacter sp.]